MRASGLIPILLMAAGCTATPLQPVLDPNPAAETADVRVAAGESFALRAGEVASVADGEVLVGFRRVRADSRCPADVTCVWAGDAEVEIGVAPEGGTWAWYSLHTGVEPRAVTVEAFRVRLEGLRPTPTRETAADPREYVAHLSVGRV